MAGFVVVVMWLWLAILAFPFINADRAPCKGTWSVDALSSAVFWPTEMTLRVFAGPMYDTCKGKLERFP